MPQQKITSQQKLETAYFDMLEKMHYSKITVSDIIRYSEVSRTTFYRHYDDIFDMHKKIAEKLGSVLMETCLEIVITATSEQECFDRILDIFNSQERYIVLLSGENGSRYFFESMFRKAEKDLFPAFSHLTEDQMFRIKFMTISLIGVYVRDIIEKREHNTRYITLCKKLLNFEELFGGYYAGKC